MLHRTGEITEFFDNVAPELAQALALHWGERSSDDAAAACARSERAAGSVGAVRSVWREELSLVCRVARVARRAELTQVAAQRFALTRPDWTRLLRRGSAEDTTTRLFLESPECFVRAHAPLLAVCQGELCQQRARYVADVVPSHDRLEAMESSLRNLHRELGLGPVVCEHFSDDHQLSMFAAVEGRLHAQLGFSFFFEAGALCVRAPTRFERARVSAAFARIFARDPSYFDAEPADGRAAFAGISVPGRRRRSMHHGAALAERAHASHRAPGLRRLA